MGASLTYLDKIKKLWRERDAYQRKIDEIEQCVDRELRELARSGDYRAVALSTLYWEHPDRVAPERLARQFGLTKPGELAAFAGERRVALTCLVCEEPTVFKPTSLSAYKALVNEGASAMPEHRICSGCRADREGLLNALRRKKGKRLTKAQYQGYQDYLKSDAWQEKRQAALKRAKHRCQVCNGRLRLEVHHRTYERLGNERMADLTVLCERCHETHHDH